MEHIAMLNAGQIAQLKRFCIIFGMPYGVADDNPEGALTVLSLLYAMPAKKNHAERRRFGNEILQSASVYFPYSGPEATQKSVHFFSLLQGLVITIQEFPSWYWELAATGEDLVRAYKYWVVTAAVLALLGFGSYTQALNGAGAEIIKQEKLKPGPDGKPPGLLRKFGHRVGPGAKVAIDRLSGRTPIVDGILKRWGAAGFASGAVAPLLMGVVAAAMVTLTVAAVEIPKLRQVITDRYQRGELSKELFNEMLSFPPSFVSAEDIKKYWEM